MKNAASSGPAISARSELNSHSDILEYLTSRANSPHTLGIDKIVLSLDAERSVAFLKYLIKCLDGVDGLVQSHTPHECRENSLKLAPDYLTSEIRLLIEWWFLPLLHRVKAEMSRPDSQGHQEGARS